MARECKDHSDEVYSPYRFFLQLSANSRETSQNDTYNSIKTGYLLYISIERRS